MKNWIDILKALEDGDVETLTGEMEGAHADEYSPDVIDAMKKMQDHFDTTMKKIGLAHQIDRVFEYVVDGVDFETAVKHVADQNGIESLDFREMVIGEYKTLRSQADTYSSPEGRSLVMKLNPTIREAIDAIVIEHMMSGDQSLMERTNGDSMFVGAYFGRGASFKVLRARHDYNHFMIMNDKGEIVASHHGEADDLHKELTAQGLTGAIKA